MASGRSATFEEMCACAGTFGAPGGVVELEPLIKTVKLLPAGVCSAQRREGAAVLACTGNVRMLTLNFTTERTAMTANAKRATKEERIDLRLSAKAKALLQRAAAVRHKTVTEFVLDSGLSAAAEALADRREFLLDERQWRAFLSALDAPSKLKPRLKSLLKNRGVLD